MRSALVASLPITPISLRTPGAFLPALRGNEFRPRAHPMTTEDSGDRDLLERLSGGGPAAWQAFLDSCSDTIFRVVRLFAGTYDDRMDLFLYICGRLHEDDMRRLRSFRYRSEAPCRFTTWLSVVAKNLALDFIREREGRFRPFRNVEEMEGIDRLVFDYHLRDGLPLAEVRQRLRVRHGIRLEDGALGEAAGRVREALSASQRWRLLARLSQRRRHIAIDPVAGAAGNDGDAIPLRDPRGEPDRPLRSREAEAALGAALGRISSRQRLAVTLRFRDGMTAREAAALMSIEPGEAERLSREGVAAIRVDLERSGFAPPDFEEAGLSTVWPS